MTVRLFLLLACLPIFAGCMEDGYSSVPASVPGPPAANEAQPEKVVAPTESRAAASSEASPDAQSDSQSNPTPEESPAPKPAVAEAAIQAANKLLPIKDITFDDIKFDIEKDSKFERSMLTPKIEELNGRSVRIRGYILPTFQQSGIRNFVLVRDNMECCFGPGAAIYDCIIVDMVGATADFTTRPVTVDGELTFREVLDFDGITRAIYHLDGVRVK